MKIFISHSSRNANIGKALVNLLTGVGVDHESIIFTSETSYGIPVGKNIFDWLKEQITAKPFVIYLLSPQYFESVACLNEMGAAWIVESQHAAIFTPDFDLSDQSFRNGVLDPREMGFRISDEDRLTEFIESLRGGFNITRNPVLINSKRREFLENVASAILSNSAMIEKTVNESSSQTYEIPLQSEPNRPNHDTIDTIQSKSVTVLKGLSSDRSVSATQKFFQDLVDGKLKDEEVLLIHYASDTARYSFGVGWKLTDELQRIREWEEMNNLGEGLSSKFEQALNRLGIKKLTRVSEVTSHNNPRLISLVDEMYTKIIDLPQEFHQKCDEAISRSSAAQAAKKRGDIPF